MIEQNFLYDVFICYDIQDDSFVSAVVRELQEHQISVWIDKNELYKYAGEYHEKNIRKGIDESAVVLYIHSVHSLSNSLVQNVEIPYAIGQNKRILTYSKEGELNEWGKNTALRFYDDIKILTNPESNYQDPIYSIRVALQRCFGRLTPSGHYETLETNSVVFRPQDLEAVLTDDTFILPIPKPYKEELASFNFKTDECKLKNNNYLDRIKVLLNRKCPEIVGIDEYINNVCMDTARDFLQKKKMRRTIFNGWMLGVSKIEARRSPDGKETHSMKIEFYLSDYFTFKVMSRVYQDLRKACGHTDLFAIKSLQDIEAYSPFLVSLGMGGFVLTEEDNTEIKALWIKRGTECEAGNLYHFSFDETVSTKDINSDTMEVDLYNALYRGLKEELNIHPHDLTGQGGIFEIGIILTATRIELEMLSFVMLNPSKKDILWDKIRGAEDGKLEVGAGFLWNFEQYKQELTDKLLTPESLYLIRNLETRWHDHKLLGYRMTSPKSQIDEKATIGYGTTVDEYTIINGNANIGEDCKIHRFIYIDSGVQIGSRVKIQDHVMIPHGVTLEDGVFVGPSVVFTNDKYPRSVMEDGKLKKGNDWTVSPTIIKEGASLGGGAVVVCGVTVGKWAMVAAGAVVTKDVPDYALVMGCPAKVVGEVNKQGEITKRF